MTSERFPCTVLLIDDDELSRAVLELVPHRRTASRVIEAFPSGAAALAQLDEAGKSLPRSTQYFAIMQMPGLHATTRLLAAMRPLNSARGQRLMLVDEREAQPVAGAPSRAFDAFLS